MCYPFESVRWSSAKKKRKESNLFFLSEDLKACYLIESGRGTCKCFTRLLKTIINAIKLLQTNPFWKVLLKTVRKCALCHLPQKVWTWITRFPGKTSKIWFGNFWAIYVGNFLANFQVSSFTGVGRKWGHMWKEGIHFWPDPNTKILNSPLASLGRDSIPQFWEDLLNIIEWVFLD